ncbi:MAG: L,D-transpeptidase [Magnetococcales bacterium]|nr:L,D-transpeptidase [Magnetococcales bacterium]
MTFQANSGSGFFPGEAWNHVRDRLIQGGWDLQSPALLALGEEQRLLLLSETGVVEEWPISTGKKGFGNTENSYKTPTGLHQVSHKIGDGEPLGMVFKGRVATGEIVADGVDPGEDLITTRILRLTGLEPGINQGPGVDSFERYIYIHGTPHGHLLGEPHSAGCIRMDNRGVLALYELIDVGTPLLILPSNKVA